MIIGVLAHEDILAGCVAALLAVQSAAPDAEAPEQPAVAAKDFEGKVAAVEGKVAPVEGRSSGGSDKGSINQQINDRYKDILQQYRKELEAIHAIFDAHKAAPPLFVAASTASTRRRLTTSSATCWRSNSLWPSAASARASPPTSSQNYKRWCGSRSGCSARATSRAAVACFSILDTSSESTPMSA